MSAAIRATTAAPCVGPIGALALWRAELCAGKGSARVMDALWRAAVHEAQGADYDRMGLHDMAAARYAEATAVLVEVPR